MSSHLSPALLLPGCGVLREGSFTLRREDAWRLPEMRGTAIRFASVGGGNIFISAGDGRILRWNAADVMDGKPSMTAVIDCEPKDVRLDAIFVEENALFALFCGLSVSKNRPSTLLYRANSGNKAREVIDDALRGEKVECVAWLREVRGRTDLQHVLLGTASGVVLLATDDGATLRCKQIWKLPDGIRQPIVAIQAERVGEGADVKYFAMVVTGDKAKSLRLFRFIGSSPDSIFTSGTSLSSHTSSSSAPLVFQEFTAPAGTTATHENPCLSWFVTSSGCATSPPVSHYSSGPTDWRPDIFALSSHAGLYTGALRLYPTVHSLEGVLADTQLIPYPLIHGAALSMSGGGKRTVPTSRGGLSAESTSANNKVTQSAPTSVIPSEYPLSLALTDYHIVLLYRQRLVVLSRISLGVVYELSLPEERYGVIRGMAMDAAFPMRPLLRAGAWRSVWIYSDRSLFELTIAGEAEDVWKLLVLSAKFEDARSLVSASRSKTELINAAEAQYWMQAGDFATAADLWVKTSVPFEEICLKFIHAGATRELERFVSAKLQSIEDAIDTDEDFQRAKLQKTILCTWLTEMYLNHLNTLQQPAMNYGGAASAEYDDCASKFKRFLVEHRESLDKATTLSLLASHGRTEELLYYCDITQDFDKVISFHVQSGDYEAALEALAAVPLPHFEELWYVYSPILMQHVPKLTVEKWKATVSRDGDGGLDPARLIPAMVRYEQTRNALAKVVEAAAASKAKVPAAGEATTGSMSALGPDFADFASDHALHYLQWTVNSKARGHRDRAVHNFLISLYAKQPVEEMLLDYIDVQTYELRSEFAEAARKQYLATLDDPFESDRYGIFGDESAEETTGPLFDLQYALRICLAEGRHRACVQLYTAIGLYEEAVELALKTFSQSGDPELDAVGLQYAKDAANACPAGDKPLRKKLWMRLASWVIAHGGGVKQALEVLHDSDDVLRIEDLLVFFPDITLIDEFKTEISHSLHECHNNIDNLRKEMRGYQDAAERIRSDIRSLRNRCGFVRVSQKCDLCSRAVLSSHFYLFPCSHAFHRDCLLDEVGRHLSTVSKRRLDGLANDLVRVNAAAEALGGSNTGSAGSTSAQEKSRSAINTSAVNASPAELLQALYRRRDHLQNDIDKLVADECLLCGHIMIDSIADPFETTGNWDL